MNSLALPRDLDSVALPNWQQAAHGDTRQQALPFHHVPGRPLASVGNAAQLLDIFGYLAANLPPEGHCELQMTVSPSTRGGFAADVIYAGTGNAALHASPCRWLNVEYLDEHLAALQADVALGRLHNPVRVLLWASGHADVLPPALARQAAASL